jgi:hypothetical protein
LEEYKICKDLLTQADEHVNRQNALIGYVSGFFVAALGALYAAGSSAEPSSPMSERVPPGVIFGAGVALVSFIIYAVAAIADASLRARVIRIRMRLLERKIATTSESAPEIQRNLSKFVDGSFLSDGKATPHFASGLWRLFLFVSTMYLIAANMFALTYQTNPVGFHIFNYSMIFFSVYVVMIYMDIYSFGSTASIMRNTASRDIESRDLFLNRLYIDMTRYILFSIPYTLYAMYALYRNEVSMLIYGFADIFYLSVSLFSGVYVFLGTIALPIPIEAPVILLDHGNVILVVAACLAGKAVGTAALYYGVGVVPTLLEKLRLDGVLGSSFLRATRQINVLRKRSPKVVYFLCHAVPFGPMRSATLTVATLEAASTDRHPMRWIILSTVALPFRAALLVLILLAGLAATPAWPPTLQGGVPSESQKAR